MQISCIFEKNVWCEFHQGQNRGVDRCYMDDERACSIIVFFQKYDALSTKIDA